MTVNEVKRTLEERYGDKIKLEIDRDYVWVGGQTYGIKDELKADFGAQYRKRGWFVDCRRTLPIEKQPQKSKRKRTEAEQVKVREQRKVERKRKAARRKAKRPQIPDIQFEVSWGSADLSPNEKMRAFGKSEFDAKTFTAAKAKATQLVRLWAEENDKKTTESLKLMRQTIHTAMQLGRGKWSQKKVSEKTGRTFAVKHLGGMWGGGYILLKQVTDVSENPRV